MKGGGQWPCQEPIEDGGTYHRKKAYFSGLNFREHPHKIWSYMVLTYLHKKRILKISHWEGIGMNLPELLMAMASNPRLLPNEITWNSVLGVCEKSLAWEWVLAVQDVAAKLWMDETGWFLWHLLVNHGKSSSKSCTFFGNQETQQYFPVVNPLERGNRWFGNLFLTSKTSQRSGSFDAILSASSKTSSWKVATSLMEQVEFRVWISVSDFSSRTPPIKRRLHCREP